MYQIADPGRPHTIVRMDKVAGVWKSMRPRQWVKNVLLLAVPALDGSIIGEAGVVALGFLSWCLVASGAYLWNDANDVERDRIHPIKKNRPIAAGVVSESTARVSAVSVILVGLGIGAFAGTNYLLVLSAYAVHTFSYSLWLKHVPTVEIVALSSGFVLRTVAGAVIVDAFISAWFFVVVAGGSLLLASGKRSAELKHGASVRSVLAEYTPEYLTTIRGAAVAVAATSYIVWVFEGTLGGSVAAQVSILPYLTTLLRYAQHASNGEGGEPEELIFRDKVIALNGLAWLTCLGIGITMGGWL